MSIARKRVVITGMGHISSIASNITEFKHALLNKTCGIKPSEKYLAYFEDANASEVTQSLSWPGLFDELAETLDKAALWAYRVGREALEQGNIPVGELREQTGLVVGVSSAATEAWLPIIENKMDQLSLAKIDHCGSFSSCSAVVSSLLSLKGGVELVATACTASTNAMGIGYDWIQNDKNKTVLIVGTEPLYLPTFAGFYALHAMKRTATSPFSGDPGMSIGEGAGALLLEEYEHAIARGATIYGEFVSYATSCDACHETAPDPMAGGAVQVMKHAMINANITAEDIDYINAHGTGTEANDRCETVAMKKVFPGIDAIPVSSTKSYIGHNIGAAGIVEMIACFLTLPEKKVLPTLNFTTPRANCDLNYVPNEFQYKDVSLFMKNNYAFGGNNCCVIGSVKPGASPGSTYQKKRVAITGIGTVSSAGHQLPDLLQTLYQGSTRSRLNPCDIADSNDKALIDWLTWLSQQGTTEPDNNVMTSPVGSHRVQELEPRKMLRGFNPRKADAIGTFALLAVTEAMRGAQRKIKRDGENLGLILGMARGPQSTIYRYLKSLIPDPSKVRTSEFPGTLMNAISTFCAISEGIKGYSTTLAGGVNAALGALTYGYEIIRQSLQPQVIVGGADESMSTFSRYFQSLRNETLLTTDPEDFKVYSLEANGYISGEGAAMLFLEDYDQADAQGKTIHAEISGYGKASDGCYFDKQNIAERSRTMATAIKQALAEAQLNPVDIDLICGTSNGTDLSNRIETEGVLLALGQAAHSVPFVNYIAWFGLLESCSAIMNIAIITEIMRCGEIPPIPYTGVFCTEQLNFVSKIPIKRQVKHAMVIGVTDSGTHYALILRNPS